MEDKKMSQFGFRDNKFTAKEFASKRYTVERKSNEDVKSVPFIKLESAQVGTAGLGADKYAYLYVGTGGAILVSSVAPSGTTGAFSNVGGQIGTVA